MESARDHENNHVIKEMNDVPDSEHQPLGAERRQEPEPDAKSLATAIPACPRVCGSTRRRRRRRLRDQPGSSEPGQRPEPGDAEQPGRGLARTDRAGFAERRAADAPAHPRARRPGRERHDLQRRSGIDQRRGHAAGRRIERVGETTSFNGIKLLAGKERSPSRSAPTTKKRSKSKRSNSRNDQRPDQRRWRRIADETDRSDRQSQCCGRRIRRSAGPCPVRGEQHRSVRPEPPVGGQRHHRREHGS